MKGELRAFSLEGRPCACYVPQGEGPFPLLVLCGWGLEEKLPLFAQELPPVVLFTAQADGGRDFTPWPAPGIREGEAFTGEAGDYLGFLTERALPLLERDFRAHRPASAPGDSGLLLGRAVRLVGPSAKGRCSAWRARCPAPLWYPGWLGYMEQHPPRPGACVYLSLGDREELGGPPLLRTRGGLHPPGPRLLQGKGPGHHPGVEQGRPRQRGGHPLEKGPALGRGAAGIRALGPVPAPWARGQTKKTRKILMKFSIQYLFKEV